MPFTAPLRDLNKLNTFVRVAQRRSFTKAAAELRTTPSVISKRIKELEEALGFTLLNRSTHGLTLTDAGEGLFQNCLEMLAKVEERKQSIIDGSFDMFAGPITDNTGAVVIAEGETVPFEERINCCQWLVEGVVGEIPG